MRCSLKHSNEITAENISSLSVSETIRQNSKNTETLNTMVKDIRERSEQLDTPAK